MADQSGSAKRATRKAAVVQGAAAGAKAGPAGAVAGAAKAVQQQKKAAKAGPAAAKKPAAKQAPAPARGQGRPSGAGRKASGGDLTALGKATMKFPRKMLLAELVVCLVIVWGGTLVAPRGSHNGTTRAMVKTSGLAALFLVLALVSSAGKGASKAASALGGLVTIAYLFTSSDAVELTKWIGAFFKAGPDQGAQAPAPEGEITGGGIGSNGPPRPRPGITDASSTPERQAG